MKPVLSIQYLRALAATGVVAFHLADRMRVPFLGGACGVDVFFVISGFIMWTVGGRETGSPAAFLWRRLKRVAPMYWLVTLGMSALAAAAPFTFPNLHPNWPRVILSLGFVPHVGSDGRAHPILDAGWTLDREMFFYALFAAALTLPARWRLPALGGTLATLAVAGMVLRPADPIATAYTDPLLLEFAGGLMAGWAWTGGRLPRPAAGLALAAGGVGVLAWLQAAHVHHEAWRVLEWGVPAAAIVTGALAWERGRGMWLSPGLKELGDASYALYLTHPFTLALFLKLTPRMPAAPRFALCLAAAVLAGVLAFRLIEGPLHRRLAGRRIAAPGGWRAVGTALPAG